MTIRSLIAQGLDIDANIEFRSIVQNSKGESIDIDNRPVFEVYLDPEDEALHIDSVYEISDDNSEITGCMNSVKEEPKND